MFRTQSRRLENLLTVMSSTMEALRQTDLGAVNTVAKGASKLVPVERRRWRLALELEANHVVEIDVDQIEFAIVVEVLKQWGARGVPGESM